MAPETDNSINEGGCLVRGRDARCIVGLPMSIA
jgi:hypothetical protein